VWLRKYDQIYEKVSTQRNGKGLQLLLQAYR
jgi:hypothetical protein